MVFNREENRYQLKEPSVERKEVEEKVIEIVATVLAQDKKELNLEYSFKKDLSADSIAILDIMMEAEEKFQITIPDEDAEGIKTIGDAVDYICKNLN